MSGSYRYLSFQPGVHHSTNPASSRLTFGGAHGGGTEGLPEAAQPRARVGCPAVFRISLASRSRFSAAWRPRMAWSRSLTAARRRRRSASRSSRAAVRSCSTPRFADSTC